MPETLNHQQYDRISKTVVSKIRNRPWTWEGVDVYQEAYSLCLEYDPKFPRLVRKWGREKWLLSTVSNEVIRRCGREQDWARRKFPLEQRKILDTGLIPYVSQQEAMFIDCGTPRFMPSKDPAAFLADHSCPEEYTDLMDAVAALKPRERQMVLLILKGWTPKNITNYRGISQQAVDNTLRKAVSNLRTLMGVN